MSGTRAKIVYVQPYADAKVEYRSVSLSGVSLCRQS